VLENGGRKHQIFASAAAHDAGFAEKRIHGGVGTGQAPVCEDAARMPASDAPALMPAMRQPFR
jgi:hypothetical protein